MCNAWWDEPRRDCPRGARRALLRSQEPTTSYRPGSEWTLLKGHDGQTALVVGLLTHPFQVDHFPMLACVRTRLRSTGPDGWLGTRRLANDERCLERQQLSDCPRETGHTTGPDRGARKTHFSAVLEGFQRGYFH